MKKVIRIISGIWFYIFGNLFSLFFYKKRFIKGKYFNGKFGGVFSLGWRWIFNDALARMFLNVNRGVPFPVSPFINIVNPDNIFFDSDDLNNFQGIGKYFQALSGGKIYIGKGSWIANNVGIITSNHNPADLNNHQEGKNVVLGENCWIGMNSMILPGVNLGPNTIVGAGSIVTKSFLDGNVVIAGNPAKVIKKNIQ